MADPQGGGFFADLFKGIAMLPVGLAKNVVGALQDPLSAFNEKGQPSVTRLFVPGFREAKVKEAKLAADLQKAQLQAELTAPFKMLFDMAQQQPTHTGISQMNYGLTGRPNAAEQARHPDAPRLAENPDAPYYDNPEAVNAATRAASEGLKKSRQAQRAAGVSYEGSLIADPASARATVQATHQAQQTRQTQSQQHGFRLGEQGNAARLARETYKQNADYETGAQQSRKEYDRFVAAGDSQGALAALGGLPSVQPGSPDAESYRVLANLPAGHPLAKTISEGILANNIAAGKPAADGKRSVTPEAAQQFIQRNGQDPAFWEGLPPALRDLAREGGLYGGAPAVEFFDQYAKYRPTRLGDKAAQEKQDAAAAEEFNRVVAATLPDGFLRRRALAAKGNQAIQVATRVIDKTDFTGADQRSLDALVNYTQLPGWQNVPQETKDKANAILAAGSPELAGDLVKGLPLNQKENVEDQSASDFIRSVLATPGLDDKTVPQKWRDSLLLAATAKGDIAKDAAKTLWEKITKVGSGDMAKLMGNPYGRKLLDAQIAHEMALADLDAMERFRGKKNLFGAFAANFAAAGRASERVLGTTPSDFTNERTALETTSGGFMANFVKGLSGATVTEAEVLRLNRVGPNDQDSESAFFIKRDLMAAAKQRDLEWTLEQQQAIVRDDLAAFNAISAQRGKAIRELNDKLQKTPGSGSKDGPPPKAEDLQFLTEEERQRNAAANAMAGPSEVIR